MLQNISKTDKILLILALGTLIFSELMWFQGEKDGALFVGLWVPSILGFAIYLKLIRSKLQKKIRNSFIPKSRSCLNLN